MAEQSPFQLLLALDQAYRNRAASLPAQQEVAQYWSGIGFRMGAALCGSLGRSSRSAAGAALYPVAWRA